MSDLEVPLVVGDVDGDAPVTFLFKSNLALLPGPKLNDIIRGTCGASSSWDELNILLDVS